jgi:hemoglobin
LLPRLEFTANQFVNILDVLSFEFGIGNNRAEDSIMREKQLLIDFLCANAGGPMYYRGRDMQLSHRGMGISESDWNVFLSHADATLAKFEVPVAEQRDVVAFVQSLKKDIID